MTEPAPIPGDWSRRRFWLVAAILFAGQVGSVFLLGERPHATFPSAVPRASVRLLDVPLDDEQWTKHVFATDPTVFLFSSPHGFADLAWGLLPAKNYVPPLREPPPAFLPYASKGVETGGPVASADARPGPVLFVGVSETWSGHPPPFPQGEASRPESLVRVEGPLAARQIGPPMILPSWTTNILVSNSVVQFGVDRAGQVFSAGLVTGCGLPEADDAAVAWASRFRFRPAPPGADEFAWDTATFYWKIVPP